MLAKGFTQEELAALAPWTLPCVDIDSGASEASPAAPPVGRVVEEEIETAPRLTAEEIEAMQRQAYEEAAMEGREAGRQEGYRAGYEAGRQEGLASIQAQLAEQGVRLDALMQELTHPLRALENEIFEELSALAIALARQLIRRELRTDPGQIIAVAREALSALPSGSRKVQLHLHPDDVELVRQALFLDEKDTGWRVTEDPLLTRGGCRVTTENSTIDASVEKRLAAAIAKAFGGERGGDKP